MSLNLDNFEGDYSRDTPYILTSPTSLRACSELGIQPSELIYRSLEEYEESFCDLPLADVYRIYEENETERQAKLLKCRELRYRLKSGKSRMAITSSASSQKKSHAPNSTPVSSSSPIADDEPTHTRPRTTTVVRSTSGRSRVSSKTSSNQTSLRRYTSAPAVNGKSQGGRPTVNFQTSLEKGTSSGSLSGRTRSRSTSSKRKQQLCTSDTESAEGQLNRIIIDDPYTSTRSMPDLTRSNLDFRKLASPSPRHLCPCHWELKDREIFSSYSSRYGNLLDSPDLTPEDRKIMERLILKKGREMEWERKSQELRQLIEKDRTKRFTENQMLMQSWHDQLAEKRRFENIENTRRYLEMQEKYQENRSNLMKYLEDRDRKVQKYLEDVNYKKKKSLLERQKREALRQLEVGKAIEKIVEEDRQHRQILRDKLQRRMEEADIRKRRREKDYFRHVTEMNRMEDVKRCLKLESLEQKSRQSIEELRSQIMEKENRARKNYLNRIRSRDRALSEGSGSRQKAIEKAQAIHSDLLKGLEEWHKRVLELQIEAQKRAGIRYNQEVNRRRLRVANDRVLREERSSEMLKKVHELEAQRKDMLKSMIETKADKSARVKADKEHRVAISRIRAQHAAELRQQLKEEIDPETFDRKAARVEMELRIMKRNPPSGFSVKFHPKLISKRCSSCHGRSNGRSNGGGSSCHNINGKGSGSAGLYGRTASCLTVSSPHIHNFNCYPLKASGYPVKSLLKT